MYETHEFETDVLEDFDYDNYKNIEEVIVEYYVEPAEPENGLMDDYYGYSVWLNTTDGNPIEITDDLTLKDHSNIYHACKAHFKETMESYNDY